MMPPSGASCAGKHQRAGLRLQTEPILLPEQMAGEIVEHVFTCGDADVGPCTLWTRYSVMIGAHSDVQTFLPGCDG
jgi:hypothetical protein